MKPDNHVDIEKKAELKKLINKLDNQLDTVKNDIDIININKTLDKIESIEPIPEQNKISKVYMMNLFEDKLLDEGLRRRDIRLAEETTEKKALQKDKKPVFTAKFAKYAVAASLILGLFTVTAIGSYEAIKYNVYSNDDWVVFTTADDYRFTKQESISGDDSYVENETIYTSIERVKEELTFDFYFPIQHKIIDDIKVTDLEFVSNISTTILWKHQEVKIRIDHIKDSNSQVVQYVDKDGDYEVISAKGIEYYIIPNINWTSVVFHDDFNSYNFVGFETKEDAEQFINTL